MTRTSRPANLEPSFPSLNAARNWCIAGTRNRGPGTIQGQIGTVEISPGEQVQALAARITEAQIQIRQGQAAASLIRWRRMAYARAGERGADRDA
jgi:hypothetical protein